MTTAHGKEVQRRVASALGVQATGLLEFLSAYVQLPSEAPKEGAPDVLECQRWLADQLRRWGWQDWVEVWEAAPGEANVAVRIPGRSGSPRLMFNGHSDVVPVSPEEAGRWRHPPYSGRIDESRVWGRGSSDMKGGIAAFLWAAKTVVEMDVELEHDLLLTMNVGEESGRPDVGISSVIERGYLAPLVVNAEPTNLSVMRAAMGWLFFDVTVLGKGSHPANNYLSLNPETSSEDRPGVDANERMRRIVNGLANLGDVWATGDAHPLAPPYSTSLTLVHVEGGERSASVSAHCTATYAVVFDPLRTSRDVLRAVRKKILEVAGSDTWLRAHPPQVRAPVIDPIFEPLETPEHAPGVQEMIGVVADVIGHVPPVGCFPGPCDANVIAREDVATLIFGPGDLRFGCHGIDEYVPVEHVLKASEVYARLIVSRCG